MDWPKKVLMSVSASCRPKKRSVCAESIAVIRMEIRILHLCYNVNKFYQRDIHQRKSLRGQVIVSNRAKNLNERILYNVSNIHQAIEENVQIEFR